MVILFEHCSLAPPDTLTLNFTNIYSHVYFPRLPSTSTTLHAYYRLLSYPQRLLPTHLLHLLYLLCTQHSILDLLSKLSHDADVSTSQSAILALGLVSAGTNNSRCAGILRQLSVFYGKDRYVHVHVHVHVHVFVHV